VASGGAPQNGGLRPRSARLLSIRSDPMSTDQHDLDMKDRIEAEGEDALDEDYEGSDLSQDLFVPQRY
jgi:hypothetical protein